MEGLGTGDGNALEVGETPVSRGEEGVKEKVQG